MRHDWSHRRTPPGVQGLATLLAPLRKGRFAIVAFWAMCVTPALAQPPRELAKWLGAQRWDKDVAGPIVSLGAAGEFDDMHIFAPAVAEEQGRFSLWYCGSRGTRGTRVFRLGLATSADGKSFERSAKNPVHQFDDGVRS